MARRKSQKNKKTRPNENNEVIFEILLSDCSNYASWSTSVINAFRTIDPQLEQILDKTIIPSSYDKKNASEEDRRCLRLNYLAFDFFGNSLSKEDYHAFIIRYDEPIHDACDIWTRIKNRFDGSKHVSSYDASSSISPCETNPLKEEENEHWRPNDESTSPKGLSSHLDSHICCVANENNSGSTNDDEEDKRSFMQLYAHLSLEDKVVMLKLLKRAREQSEALHKLEDVIITKIQSLEELTKEHEELKCSHVDLVQRYETISIEQDNSLLCIAQVERLKIENLAFQEKHDMFLCSHKNLMDDHIMLNIAQEVVIENLKSQQPHSCTCVQIETILACANACCSRASKSLFGLEFPGINNVVYQELKEENDS
jgi:hypothetical protein